MDILTFKSVTKEVEYLEFDCGIQSINEYVKNSYYPHIAQQAYAYRILGNDCLLGFYQILFKEIELDHFPEEISDYYDSEVNDEKISSIHIRYIAIDKKYQRNSVGTGTLRAIIKYVEEFSNSWPIRLITIDARPELVGWYEKEGFRKMTENTVGQDGTTIAMYFDCGRFSKELFEYIDEQA